MVKERCSAEQLARMIAEKINVAAWKSPFAKITLTALCLLLFRRPPIRSVFRGGLTRSLMFFALVLN